MGLFDFLKPKKTEKERLFEKMNKEMFPGGKKQEDGEVSELHSKLEGKYDINEVRSLFFHLCALISLNPRTGRNYSVDRMHIKHQTFSNNDLNLAYDFVRCKLLFQKTGISKIKLNLMLEMERKAMAGIRGLDVDVIPQGFGKFGYEPTNPIPVDGLMAKDIYLSNLVTSSGQDIAFNRVRAVSVANIDNPIDEMAIYDRSGKFIANLYFSCYQRKISERTPDGFKFI